MVLNFMEKINGLSVVYISILHFIFVKKHIRDAGIDGKFPPGFRADEVAFQNFDLEKSGNE